MDKLLIRGGRALHGEVLISGAKNAALPELCAALLSAQPVTLHNVPRLQDVATMLKLIRNMGVTAERDDNGTVQLNAGALNNPEAPYELVKTMRASVLAVGPLLARFGKAHQGPAGHGCHHHRGKRLYECQPARRLDQAQGCTHHHRHGDRDGH